MSEGILITALESHGITWTEHDGSIWARVGYSRRLVPAGRYSQLRKGSEDRLPDPDWVSGSEWERVTARSVSELLDWLGY